MTRCAACSRAIRSWRSDRQLRVLERRTARSATASANRRSLWSAWCPHPGRGQHAEQPPAGHDRHGEHPLEIERLHAVGVARARVGPVALDRSGGGGDAAGDPLPTRGRRSSVCSRHRFASVRPRRRMPPHEPSRAVVDAEQRLASASSGPGARGDGSDRGGAVQ